MNCILRYMAYVIYKSWTLKYYCLVRLFRNQLNLMELLFPGTEFFKVTQFIIIYSFIIQIEQYFIFSLWFRLIFLG